MYHRFGEDQHPSTNIRLDQFDNHIRILQEGGFTVLPLAEIISRLKRRATLPDRTVAITVDDAYLSVYEEAWPRLKAAGFPFTVFVATDEVDSGGPDFMTWAQLREMAEAGVTIGSHSASHGHLVGLPEDQVSQDLAQANQRFQDELGKVPELFAYPYGEYDWRLQTTVLETGYKAAFGQHSGVAHGGSDFFALPRFPMNEQYGGEERFRTAINALPFPVYNVSPADPVLQEKDNPPAFHFAVNPASIGPEAISCFVSGQGAVPVERPGPHQVKLNLTQAFPRGRTRINCTQLAEAGRYRWYGTQFLVP